MGLFSSYSKEGKGVSKYTPEKTRFADFIELVIRKFGKLIELNLMFLLAAALFALVPTLIGLFFMRKSAFFFQFLLVCGMILAFSGPAMAGMTYILRNIVQKRTYFMIADFVDNIKENWKQSLAVSLLESVLAVIVTLSLSFYWTQSSSNSIMLIPMVVTGVLAFILILASFYPYLMIVTLDLKLSAILKNCFIFAIVGMKTNLLTLLFAGGLSFLVIWFFPVSLLPMIVFGFSLIVFIVCYNSYQYVEKYCVKPYYDQQKEENGEEEDDEVIFQDTVGLPEDKESK